MKTQVIQLDINDTVISIRDRMAWAKTPRILLIWPRRGGVSIRPLDLTLLRRQAESQGASLGLVTRDGQIRSAARDLSISVFSRSADAQKKHWLERSSTDPTRRAPRTDLRAIRSSLPASNLFNFVGHPIRRVLVFAIGVLSVVAVMLVFIPSAEIQINMPLEDQSVSIPVSSSRDVRNVQISGSIPQHSLTIMVDTSGTALATGTITLPGKKASGEVLLMNLTDKAVSVPSGTILLTHTKPPVAFVTEETSQVPGGKGKTVKTLIRAQAAGEAGNVPAAIVTLFDQSLGLQLAVSNPEPIAGGTQSIVPLITDQDRESLKKRLLADLRRKALDLFSARVSAGDVLFSDTLDQSRVVDETYSPPAGETGEKLSLNLQVEYTVAFAAYSDLKLLAENVLNASLPVGFSPAPAQIDLESVSDYSVRDGIVSWQINAKRVVRRNLQIGQVIMLVRGNTPSVAANLLVETLGLKQSPRISLHPNWWPWLPFLPIRIAVEG